MCNRNQCPAHRLKAKLHICSSDARGDNKNDYITADELRSEREKAKEESKRGNNSQYATGREKEEENV